MIHLSSSQIYDMHPDELKQIVPLWLFKLITGYKTKEQYQKGLRHHREIVCLTKSRNGGWKAWKAYKSK